MSTFSRCAISLAFLTSFFFLSGCSETKSADIPSILGNPPEVAYIDVFYEHEFGADGGDNILVYRIVDGPSWLNIESINGAKPSFRIFGVPALDPAINFNTYEETPFEFTLEVSDGPQSQQFSYKVALQKNKVDFSLAAVEAIEAKQVEEIEKGVFDENCDIPELKSKTVGGKTLYPIPIFVSMANPSVSDVTLKITLDNSFNDLKDSRDISNIRSAQENIDYINEDKFVTLKAGVQTCLFSIDIIDDDIIEAAESFDLTIAEATEGLVEHERPGLAKVTITDNEPTVEFTGEEIILTEGKTSKSYDVLLSEAIDYPVFVNLYADKASTAVAADFELSKTTLTFSPGSTKQSFTVEIKADADVISTKDLDETLIIKTDVSDIFEHTPLNITINEWIGVKEVASSLSNATSHALITDTNQNVVILNSVDNATKDVELLFLDRRATAKTFSNPASDGSIDSGSDDTPVALGYQLSGSNNNLVALIETEGVLGASHFGGKDIFVRAYTRKTTKDFYLKLWDKQIGTAANDVPKGIYVDPLGNIIVYGYSEGTFSAGNSNQGNKDAFISKFDKDGNELWTKLIGTNQEDIATGVTVVGNSYIVVGTTKGALKINQGGKDGFIATLNDDGSTKSIHQFGTIYDDEVTGVTTYNNLVRIAGHSQGDVTPTTDKSIDPAAFKNSVDGFYLTFNTVYDVINGIMWGDDTAPESTTALTNLVEKSYIGGLTQGYLTDQTSQGLNDATLIAIDSSSLNSEIVWRTQFGTGGNDKVVDIDIESKKIITLWESIDGGITTYNISPFSPNGKDLTK